MENLKIYDKNKFQFMIDDLAIKVSDELKVFMNKDNLLQK